METYNGNFEYAVNKANELISEDKEGLIVSVADKTGFAIGRENNTCNREEVSEQGGAVYEGAYYGGTCVVFQGDINLCRLTHNADSWGKHILNQVKKYLRSKGLQTMPSGNDLLVYENGNAYKVASYAEGYNGDMFEAVVHISIGMDLDLIRDICTKPMNKIPKGLQDYNINADEIIQYLTNKRLI